MGGRHSPVARVLGTTPGTMNGTTTSERRWARPISAAIDKQVQKKLAHTIKEAEAV